MRAVRLQKKLKGVTSANVATTAEANIWVIGTLSYNLAQQYVSIEIVPYEDQETARTHGQYRAPTKTAPGGASLGSLSHRFGIKRWHQQIRLADFKTPFDPDGDMIGQTLTQTMMDPFWDGAAIINL